MDLKVTKVSISSGDTQRSRVYVDIKGEGIWESFAARTSRPYNLWRPLVKAALEREGWTGVQLSWSQRAGCPCPCSPGFIVTAGGKPRKVVWVEITGGPNSVDIREYNLRAQALSDDPTIPVSLENTSVEE